VRGTANRTATLVRQVIHNTAGDRLASDITGRLLAGVTEPVLEQAFKYWKNVDCTLGKRVQKGVRDGQA
jgi:catalase